MFKSVLSETLEHTAYGQIISYITAINNTQAENISLAIHRHSRFRLSLFCITYYSELGKERLTLHTEFDLLLTNEVRHRSYEHGEKVNFWLDKSENQELWPKFKHILDRKIVDQRILIRKLNSTILIYNTQSQRVILIFYENLIFQLYQQQVKLNLQNLSLLGNWIFLYRVYKHLKLQGVIDLVQSSINFFRDTLPFTFKGFWSILLSRHFP